VKFHDALAACAKHRLFSLPGGVVTVLEPAAGSANNNDGDELLIKNLLCGYDGVYSTIMIP
jgi:hypothetical protein